MLKELGRKQGLKISTTRLSYKTIMYAVTILRCDQLACLIDKGKIVFTIRRSSGKSIATVKWNPMLQDAMTYSLNANHVKAVNYNVQLNCKISTLCSRVSLDL